MKEIVFATNNMHKRDEVARMLEGKYSILTLKELGHLEDIPEDADTLEGNAAIKARFIHERYGVNCFADDTGLEVSALNGAPGVHTARYAGESKDPDANMNKLLSSLEEKEDRNAQFRTVVCLILDGREHFFEGIAKGKIASARSGAQGFGYDPIFIPEGYTKTFAEISQDEKNAISHRGKAIRALIKFLNAEQ